jgi:hypothetical protein
MLGSVFKPFSTTPNKTKEYSPEYRSPQIWLALRLRAVPPRTREDVKKFEK